MSKKRTKLDKSQRQADQLEKRVERQPEQTPPKKPISNEEIGQAPAPTTRQAE